MRVDTTVVKTDVHHPIDSTLLGDGVRVPDPHDEEDHKDRGRGRDWIGGWCRVPKCRHTFAAFPPILQVLSAQRREIRCVQKGTTMTARVWPISYLRLLSLFSTLVQIFTSLLLSSQLTLAQFAQQGPKLVGADT